MTSEGAGELEALVRLMPPPTQPRDAGDSDRWPQVELRLGRQLPSDYKAFVAIHELETEVLAASIRNPLHMTQAALAGAHVATLPFKVLKQMVHHPLTDSGITQFRSDWEKARQALAARDGGEKKEVAVSANKPGE